MATVCDESDDIDEFIVYELTKEEDESFDEHFNDNETIIVTEQIKDINEEDEHDNIIEEEDFEELNEVQEQEETYEDEVRDADELQDTLEAGNSVVQKSKVYSGPNGPKRYMLFDELIATIVDYDDDNTPIVEFGMANNEIDDKLPVECGICPDVMHKSKLSSHLQTHRLPGTNRYQCIYCEETYKDYKYLAGHARRHMGIRPYVCEECKLYFSTKQDLRVHNQRRHQTKELICEICGKAFAQNTMLKRHRESTHERKRRFQCEHCHKAYYKNFSLQEHIRSVHMGQRRMLVCPFCGMQCRDAHKMAGHRKMWHLNQKHYECSVCQEKFTNINYFDAHKRSIQCRNNTRRKVEEEDQKLLLAEEQKQQEEHDITPHEEEEQLILQIDKQEPEDDIDAEVEYIYEVAVDDNDIN